MLLTLRAHTRRTVVAQAAIVAFDERTRLARIRGGSTSIQIPEYRYGPHK